jgi:polysaccharide pyruvyl transferase WcaK-like protein
MRFLIANANDVENIGVRLRLKVLIDILKKVDKRSEIVIHATGSKLSKLDAKYDVKNSLYQYLLEQKNPLVIVYRFLKLLCVSIFVKMSTVSIFKTIRKDRLVKIVLDYRENDLVIILGGGWIKSGSGIKSNIDLLCKLTTIVLAKYFNKQIVVMPISFGPFPNSIVKKLSTRALKMANCVLVREKASYRLLRKHLGGKLKLSKDLLLLYERKSKSVKSSLKPAKRHLNIAISMMNWESKDGCRNLALATEQLSKNYHLKILPIFLDPAGASIEQRNFETFFNYLKLNKDIININKPRGDIINILYKADLVISTRTNSTLLSIVYEKPFITISKYEKVKNMLKYLDLEFLFIDENMYDSSTLIDKITHVIKNHSKYRKMIYKIHSKIASREKTKIMNIISELT